MSDTQKDDEFYQMADDFIALANQKSKQAGGGKTSATFLYAAARYNIFIGASESTSKEDFAARKKQIMHYFQAEYEKMLEEHFANYHEYFDRYMGKPSN